MIRKCEAQDFETIYEIINDAAQAYQGAIPADQWHQPYMGRPELAAEIAAGVDFWGYEDEGGLIGVMGIQPKGEVDLIRHAYVRTSCRNQGIGGQLLRFLQRQTAQPILIGTWQAAVWAVRFYEKHGFRLVDPGVKDRLLQRYWSVGERQIATSVVLADARWLQRER